MNYSSNEQLMPREEMLEVFGKGKKFSIGLPKETSFQEKRISLIPDAVNMLVENGHEVVIQREAGLAAHFTDSNYAESGARLVDTAEEIFKSDIVLKVAPLSLNEINYMKGHQTLLSALHLPGLKKAYFKTLMGKRITAIAFEFIKDKSNASPVVRSISEITGTAAIQIAGEYLSHVKYGTGKMLGGFTGISPSEVVIIGAGTVGEYACKMATGMGAMVKIFDNSIYKLQRLKATVNPNLFTSTIQQSELAKALKSADVLICAMHSKHNRSPILVTEAMVARMKEGAVIVDVSIDQGGCVETSRITSHNDPVFTHAGVTHYCVPNISSRFPQTASIAISNFFAPLLIKAGESGGMENLLSQDFYFRQGVYLFKGTLTNKIIGDQFDMSYQDIDLLMAAFH